MSDTRLEEIKQRTKTGISEYMHDAEKAEIHRQDAVFLLQELERQQQEYKRLYDLHLNVIDAKFEITDQLDKLQQENIQLKQQLINATNDPSQVTNEKP